MTPHVEFFNPKMQAELEEKDAAEMRRTGAKGPAPGGDTWVWLTSYSRVPVNLNITHKYVDIFSVVLQKLINPHVTLLFIFFTF